MRRPTDYEIQPADSQRHLNGKKRKTGPVADANLLLMVPPSWDGNMMETKMLTVPLIEFPTERRFNE